MCTSIQVGAGAGMVGILLARLGASKVLNLVIIRTRSRNLHCDLA
jgi:predicted nicotinamide N-methyase